MIVVDSSAALAWSFADERTPATLAIAVRVRDETALVTSIWPLEIANILRLAVVKGRISTDDRDATLSDLARLPFIVDDQTTQHAWTTTMSLADRHELTIYDATYLELAVRRELPLATLDKKLRQAAVAESVPVLP